MCQVVLWITATRSSWRILRTSPHVLHNQSSSSWLRSRRESGGSNDGSQTAVLTRYDGTTFTNFTRTHGLVGPSIQDMAPSPDGALWIAHGGDQTNSFGVSYFDGKTFKILTTKDGLPDAKIEKVFCEPSGVAWFFMQETGMCRYDPPAGVWRHWAPHAKSWRRIMSDRCCAMKQGCCGLRRREVSVASMASPGARWTPGMSCRRMTL